jgi:hypothetical protein
MLQVVLTLTPKRARLLIKRGDEIVEDEVWAFDEPAPKAELRDIAECVFHDSYDLLNHCCHGST